jgi:hypothetical protein
LIAVLMRTFLRDEAAGGGPFPSTCLRFFRWMAKGIA